MAIDRLVRGRLVRGRPMRGRLGFEFLERRDLLAVVRLAAWNTFNGPNDLETDADFATVLSAIGSETVAGNTKRIDILAIQETDAQGAGGDSIGRIQNVLDTLYATTVYASVVSAADGGGDSTGFVYDTSTVALFDSTDVAPGLLTHTILRARFRPHDTLGESDFIVYSVHLKSGASGSDEMQRGLEASLLRGDADLLGESTPVLFVGDFNMHDSSESAFTNLVAGGAGQVQDVAAAPGDWSDNVAFTELHTQNPRDQMNDRFDLQFASEEFFDGAGIEYVESSFHVFGNDGSHTLDDAITTGTGAASAVLSALVGASDHLPIVADYETISAVPLVRIGETGGSTQVVEAGLYDTYQVVLDTVPTDNVTVTVSADPQVDIGLLTELVFTPNNALTPQTVVVKAVDDLAGEGNHTGFVSHGVASADANYDGIRAASVVVDIIDDDAPAIIINEIDANTAGIDTSEFVELYDGGVGNSSLAGRTVVLFNGSTDTAYATIDLAGQTTNSDGLFVLGNFGIGEADLIFSDDLLQNGADAVALYDGSFQAGAGVTTTNLLDAVVYGTDDADDAGLLVLLEAGQSQLNENQNSNQESESLSRSPDHGAARQSDTFSTQLPTPGQLNDPVTPGVTILQSGTRVDLEEGGASDSYQLALETIPTDAVMITVDPDSQTDLGAGAGVALLLSFTSTDALIPQTVHVTAVDDLDIESDHYSVITHVVASADTAYDGLAVGNVVASVLDNEAPITPSLVISEIMFNPDSEESEPGIAEWIEIVNTGSTPIEVGGWRFDDEDATSWGVVPQATILDPSHVAVFFDEEFTDASSFRSEWSVPSLALVIGMPWGSLANSPSETNEILELLDSTGASMDLVNFDDVNPWPSNSTEGFSIYLTDLLADNNHGSNWALSTPGIGDAGSPTGPLFSVLDVGSPGFVPASADFDGDGGIDGHDFLRWQRGFDIPVAAKSDGDADNDLDVDSADLTIWRASFGAALTPLIAGSVRSARPSFFGPSIMGRSAWGWKPVDSRLTADLVDIAFATEWLGAEANGAETLVFENGVSMETPWDSHTNALDRRLTALTPTELSELVMRSQETTNSDSLSIAGELLDCLLSCESNRPPLGC